MISKPLTLLLFFFVFTFNLDAQKTREDYLTLLDSGMHYIDQKRYSDAIKIFSKAELMANKNDWPGALWYVYDKFGYSYNALSNFGEALGYYQKALTVLKNNPNMEKILINKVVVLNNIGLMYKNMGKDQKGMVYLLKAEELSLQDSLLVSIQKSLGINIADTYNGQGQFDKALKKLKEIGHLKADTLVMITWKTTLAETLFLLGKIDQAKQLAEELFKKTQKEKNSICNICILELLSKIYAEQKQLDKAIAYTKMALEYNKEWGPRIDRYSTLADLYEQKGDMELALQYKDSVIQAKDSLSERSNRQLFESNKVKFQVQEYQNELNLKEKDYEAKVKIFLIVIVLGTVLFLFVYVWQKNRIVKQSQKRLITENRNKITELELEKEKKDKLLLESKMTALKEKSKLKQEQLKSKVSRKNRKLSAAALYHSSRNELLGEIISGLTDISAVSENKAINDYIKQLKGHLKTDSEWKEFMAHFEKVNPGFLKTMKDKHSQLTKKDIRFICYLYMNLSTKEICAILNIAPTSFWKRKQRLCEKMGLKKGELYDYILNLV